MFTPVSKLDPTELEKNILDFWERENIFHKSMEKRKNGKTYVFYEGPPTANGRPGVHHALSRSFKDIFPRYHAMTGKYVLRRGGWDTHGLPVEIEVEKKLGFTRKQDILDYGIAEFNQLCRESVLNYIEEWERFTKRLAFWVDLPTAYFTFHNSYIESVWAILKKLWEKDLLYQGFKVVPYCARCGTALSDHEVAQGYQENTPDPSVYVRMPLADQPDTSFLVWTTTPWTLPANAALAVGADVVYAKVAVQTADGETEYLILARELLEKVFRGQAFTIVEEMEGRALQGISYLPLFKFLPFSEKAHFVVTADFVTVGDGTGIVHIAPPFGADDMAVGVEYNLPILMTVNEKGHFVEEVTPYHGMWVKAADPHITRDLDERGLLFRAETYLHTYPFCWRCKTPLLYYARSTWYIRTTAYKQQLVELNQQINWVPEHVRDGRFGDWLNNNVDWALGRERFWGTPLPVWMDESGDFLVVGSVAELSALTGRDLADLELHRPHVDHITFPNPKTGKLMQRVPEVIDVWFDSGAMPFAQWHYPFENQAEFATQFPADYICEATDQTRGWFYSLHAIATLLEESVAYKNVLCLGHILDGNGEKMSKSKGNIINPWDVFNAQGADAFRWYLYTATPPGNARRFSTDLVGEVVRNFTLTLWNTYSFFVTYANLDGWSPLEMGTPAYSDLDRWILSELHTLAEQVTQAMETYDAVGATRPIERFVGELSNWYVRRSRRRFWKTISDSDKSAAYATLYECLVTVAQLIAPSMPFLADELYRNLVSRVIPGMPESVHLSQWPQVRAEAIDTALNAEMELVQKLVSQGHSARNKAALKVRQPLASAAFWTGNTSDAGLVEKYAEIIASELNVKSVRLLNSVGEAVNFQLHPLPKQLGQKFGSKLPAIRQAVAAIADTDSAAQALLSGQSLQLVVNGETLEIQPADLEVRVTAHAGFAAAAEGGLVAALVTELTPELVREGLMRDLIRALQDLRKSQGLEISDHLAINYHATPELAKAIAEHQYTIMDEVLADMLDGVADLAEGEVLRLGKEEVRVQLTKL
ncbi:MAG TPA: isoleucine--tRNA ligase [Anaerolineales bacterium]|nr:isoleucine--tRNA ligase [Anaerolineales bacterium]